MALAEAPPLPFVPLVVALSYDLAELDALLEQHFSACAVIGFGASLVVRFLRAAWTGARADVSAARALDVEWRPTFRAGAARNPVALVQVSSATVCVLVPVAHLGGLPPRLRALLEDATVWKCGCGVTDDAALMLNDWGVQLASLFDMARVAPRLGDYANPGLKGLCAAFGRALHKSKSVQLSNWAQRPLRPAQSEYAAQDAYASIWLVEQLHRTHAAAGESLLSWVARHGTAGAPAPRLEAAAEAKPRAAPTWRRPPPWLDAGEHRKRKATSTAEDHGRRHVWFE